MSMNVKESRNTLADRLEEAGLSTERFIDVEDRQKRSYDHSRQTPDSLSGNYGVYAGDGLVLFDVDDYNEDTETASLLAIAELPNTFVVKSPHTDGKPGGHRFYRVEADRGVDEFDVDQVLSRYIKPNGEKTEMYEAAKDDPVSLAIAEEFGKVNLTPSWGEIRAANQYTVGPGSRIYKGESGCDKEWCESCPPEGDDGYYQIQSDRPIATIHVDDLIQVVREDPNYAPSDDNKTVDKVSYDEREHTGLSDSTDEREILEYALEESNDDKLRRLWNGDYSDYGGDRSRAESALAYKLAFWLNGDKNAVRRAMDRANTRKWDERTDDSYRESVLEAVDEQTEYFEPQSEANVPERAPAYDTEEVERGSRILSSETTPEEPAGELIHRNGHYCYQREIKDHDTGRVKRIEYDTVTNFTLEVLEKLTIDDGRTLLKIRVHPAHPAEESYDVEVHPTVFNEARSFKENIVRGANTVFNPQGRTQQAVNDLRRTVGSQFAPTRTGVEHIGLHGDEFDEWVTPDGVMTAEGLADDPEYAYYAKGGDSESDGGAVARKWSLDPDTAHEYNPEKVARILELLPQTRRTDRGVPVLGWFYSAPLRPLIHEWTGEFNLLQVVGVTETGKTSFLKAMWEAFGMDPDPFDASDTPFTHMKHMASSNGVPVWIDEYKPADIRNDRLDELLRLLRAATKGRAVPKGRANLGEVLFYLRAPVVVSGEQKFSTSHPAVRRRAIMTNLSKIATDDGSSYSRAFAELTGRESYETEAGEIVYPDGYDLHEHARAYYQFILEKPNEELKSLWDTAGEDTKRYLSEIGSRLENTERQGAQTVLFGIRLYREFAKAVGAEMSLLPTDSDVIDAFDHMASNIGKNGQRRGYADSFLELFAQASANGYLYPGESYRFLNSQKFGGEVLAFHMPTVYGAVKKYVRDFNLDDEFNVIGKNDYLDEFKDKIERGDSYVEAVNHKTRFDDGYTKCAVIDHEYAAKVLGSDFDLRAFGIETDDDLKDASANEPSDGDGGGSIGVTTTPISDVSVGGTGYVTVSGVVTAWEATPEEVVAKNGPCETGTIKDETGVIDCVDFVGCNYTAGPLEVGDKVLIQNASVSRHNGKIQLEIKQNTTEITRVTDVDGNQTLAAATDGGDGPDSQTVIETPDPEETGTLADARRLRAILGEKGRLKKSALFGYAAERFDMNVHKATHALEKALREGLIEDKGGDEYTSV